MHLIDTSILFYGKKDNPIVARPAVNALLQPLHYPSIESKGLKETLRFFEYKASKGRFSVIKALAQASVELKRDR